MRLLPRVCFTLLISLACASILGGAGCTRRGTPSVLPSGSAAPTSRTLYVNPTTGSDTNNGAQTTPLKTITRALAIATAALATTGPLPVSEVELATGTYNKTTGEKFPLIVPSGVTINGALYGRGASKGSFINGAGEDTALEKVLGVAAGSYYATIAVASSTNGVALNNLYVGATSPALPGNAVYDAADILGTVSSTTSSFDSPPGRIAHLNGVLLPGGTFSCTSCTIGGTGYAVAAFSLATTDCSTPTSCPTLTLTGTTANGAGSIGASTGIRTDGSATVTVSNQAFSSSFYAFADDYPPVATSSGFTPGTVDFGQGNGSPQSTGGNSLLGAQKAEIHITLAGDTIDAYGDTWIPNLQGTNSGGQFRTDHTFGSPTTGRNVTIEANLTGSQVDAGPFKQPTPTPSTSPTGSPSASPSPSPSPT